MSRILVAGCNGQLGRDCQCALAAHELRPLDVPDIDITSPESVAARFAEFRPDVVVNCAGRTRSIIGSWKAGTAPCCSSRSRISSAGDSRMSSTSGL